MKDILFMLAQNNPSAVPPSAGPTLPEPIAEFLVCLPVSISDDKWVLPCGEASPAPVSPPSFPYLL